MSLFGGQTAAASQPSLFTQTQSAPSLFGGQPTQPASFFGTPASSASLFGAPASSASVFGAPLSSASLFGTAASSASLFGAPTSTGSLFGGAGSSASLFGAPASSASLFGAPASSSSLFGGAASSASLFGQTSSGSIFGASSSSFGFPNQGQTTSLFGGPIQSVQQQPNSQFMNTQGMSQQNAEYPGHTKINQLPEKERTELFAVERHLRDQRAKFNILWLKRSMIDETLGSVRLNTEDIVHAVVKVRAEIDAMQTNAATLRSAVATERSSAEPVLVALDNLIRSSGYGALTDSNDLRYGIVDVGRFQRAAHVPDEYFERIVRDLESRAHAYKAEIDEIARFLRAQGVSIGNANADIVVKSRANPRMHGALLLENISQRYNKLSTNGNSGSSVESRGKTIEDVIRRQYDFFMVVASNIANVNDNLRNLREQFLQALRSRDPDAPDPFEQADLREKADKDRQRILVERNAADNNTSLSNPVPVPTYGARNPTAVSTPTNLVLTTGALVPTKGGENGRRSSLSMGGLTNLSDVRTVEGRRRKW